MPWQKVSANKKSGQLRPLRFVAPSATLLQISYPPSSILIQLNPIYLTDPLYLSHWVSSTALNRLAVLSVLSAASSPCPDLNLIHYIF
uniref:Uncharacterized protein n=1 Tax=Myoviridae sp. ct1vM3 TaxID=2826603 RepID=A0A8S5LZ76_9CAUD|nr:MAG TPA: hypothetical protein [Myoviridae sp. ct1vM3]